MLMLKLPFRNKKGLTVAELLVVIALMAVITAIGVPAVVSQMSHTRLKRAARDVSTELNAARFRALARNTKARVDFTLNADPTPDTYRISTWNTATDAWEVDSSRVAMELEGNVDITSPGANFMVVFYPTGISSSADNATATSSAICLQNTAKSADRMRINITGTTGRIEIQTGC